MLNNVFFPPDCYLLSYKYIVLLLIIVFGPNCSFHHLLLLKLLSSSSSARAEHLVQFQSGWPVSMLEWIT